MARIETTREGMAFYLIIFGIIMLLAKQILIGGICLVIGIVAFVIMWNFPNSKNF
jgi:hypothetical protein